MGCPVWCQTPRRGAPVSARCLSARCQTPRLGLPTRCQTSRLPRCSTWPDPWKGSNSHGWRFRMGSDWPSSRPPEWSPLLPRLSPRFPGSRSWAGRRRSQRRSSSPWWASCLTSTEVGRSSKPGRSPSRLPGPVATVATFSPRVCCVTGAGYGSRLYSRNTPPPSALPRASASGARGVANGHRSSGSGAVVAVGCCRQRNPDFPERWPARGPSK
jgi:hypothetical protein